MSAYAWAAHAKASLGRLLSKVRIEPAPAFLDPALGPCLIWTGAQTKGSGKRKGGGPYGSIGVRRDDGTWTAVRCTVFVCVVEDRMVPGYHPDHLCKRSLCVSGEHLEVVTPSENSRRRWDGKRKKDRAA